LMFIAACSLECEIVSASTCTRVRVAVDLSRQRKLNAGGNRSEPNRCVVNIRSSRVPFLRRFHVHAGGEAFFNAFLCPQLARVSHCTECLYTSLSMMHVD